MTRQASSTRAPTEPSGVSPLPAAVLWDMDGTLVDTEPSWWAAERALVEAHGGTWSDTQAQALVGNQLEVSAEVLRREGGVDLEVRELIETLAASVTAGLRQDPRWQPGALELLLALRERGVPCALVTMSWRPIAEAMLEHLPRGTFDVVVTGDECERGKPHPEPYERALAALGVDARDCVVLEDSPTGLASAEAAGLATLAVPHVLDLPTAPGRTVLPTLAGVSPEDLLGLRAPRDAGQRLAGADVTGVTGHALPLREVASRRRNQPAPPSAVFEALVDPDRDPSRPWLVLEPDEQRPQVVEAFEPRLVVWSSLWPARPDARVCFDLPRDASGYGTDLRWALLCAEPEPAPEVTRRLQRRINEIINGELRYSFGQ